MHVRAAVPHALAASARSSFAADPHPELKVLPAAIVSHAAAAVAVALAEWEVEHAEAVGLASWLKDAHAELMGRAGLPPAEDVEGMPDCADDSCSMCGAPRHAHWDNGPASGCENAKLA